MTRLPPSAEILEFPPQRPFPAEVNCGQLLRDAEQQLMGGHLQSGLADLRRAMRMVDKEAGATQRNTAPGKLNTPLQVFTLGRFSILFNGEPLEFNHRSQEKPIELFKLLISLGGREINKDHVAELLWPDSTGDMANQALATTLFRLRKLVGKDCVLLKAGKLTINADYCWVDIWLFERLLNQVRESSKDADLECFQEAVDLYHGPFLSEEDFGWVIPRRERMRQKLLMNLNEVASKLSRQQRCDQAIPLYQKALEVDDLVEELYLGLMHCYVRLGRWVEAMMTYCRCRDTLQSVLSIEPGIELQGLYEKVKGQFQT